MLPVHFHLQDDTILVRTRRGGRLDAALQDAVVAFEVDDLDRVTHDGWSVAVTGVATEVTADDAVERASGVPLDRWPSPGEDSLVAISTEIVTGRRLTAQSGPTRR